MTDDDDDGDALAWEFLDNSPSIPTLVALYKSMVRSHLSRVQTDRFQVPTTGTGSR